MNKSSMFQDIFPNLYPELRSGELMVKTITLVNTQDCNLRCTYCYEHGKGEGKVMPISIAKKTIDMLFKSDIENSKYLNNKNATALILEFIGGEPFLEIDLLDEIVEYFKYKAITLNHRWKTYYMISISTNGILYLDSKVQRFLKKNDGRISVTITIDGNKELHDSCRVFPNGEGSYDIVEKAYKKYLSQDLNDRKATKLTLAPANVSYLFEATKHLYNMGLTHVFANCVFEEGWTKEHALILYNEMKKLADYLIEDEKINKYTCTLFEPTLGKSMLETDNENWCGGTGKMLAIDCDGIVYPCLRYLPFSLKEGLEPIVVGDVNNGVAILPEHKEKMEELNLITRRSQSTDECFNCPIASGCAWCSAYNYEVFGTPNKRATFICVMHKARVLANNYLWNKLFIARGMKTREPLNIPKEWALEIISEEEYNMLEDLSK